MTRRRGGPTPRLRLALATKVDQGSRAHQLHQAGLSFAEIGEQPGLSETTAWRRCRWYEDWTLPATVGLPIRRIPPQRGTAACPRGRPCVPEVDHPELHAPTGPAVWGSVPSRRPMPQPTDGWASAVQATRRGELASTPGRRPPRRRRQTPTSHRLPTPRTLSLRRGGWSWPATETAAPLTCTALGCLTATSPRGSGSPTPAPRTGGGASARRTRRGRGPGTRATASGARPDVG
jgi:hypothetical protein